MKVELQENKEEFVLEWRGVHYTVLHSINGAAKKYVPMYAFDMRSMYIEKNTSTSFNNDKVREIFQHLPCLIENPRDTLSRVKELDDEERYYRPYNDRNSKVTAHSDANYVVRLHKKFELEDENDIELVTTDHLEVYQNDQRIENPYKVRRLVFELCANQEIKVVVPVMLGIGRYNESFTACNQMFHRYEGRYTPDSVVEQVIGTNGQLSEKEVFFRACEVLIQKANEVFTKIEAKADLDNEEGHIEVENEDYTLGNILAHALSRYVVSTCYMTHLLDTSIYLYYHNRDKKNIYEVFFSAHKDLIKMLQTMQRLVEAL